MDYLDGIVKTIGHVAWPATVVGVATVVRKELRDVISALGERIRDKNSSISVGKEGLEIKASVQAQAARLESLQAQQDQVKSLAMRQLAPAVTQPTTEEKAAAKSIDSRLRQMADDYMKISLSDYAKRVRAKSLSAQEMAFYVTANHISKDELARENHEGLLIALAASIVLSAESGDAEKLLKAGRAAQRLHVRYYVLIALAKLLERKLVGLSNLSEIRSLLHAYENGADDSLKRTILNVSSLLQETLSTPP